MQLSGVNPRAVYIDDNPVKTLAVSFGAKAVSSYTCLVERFSASNSDATERIGLGRGINYEPATLPTTVSSTMRTIHKGLIVVFVPLIFEVAFVSYVMKCMVDAFDLTERNFKNNEVIERIAKIEDGIKAESLEVAAYSVRASTHENLQQLVGAKRHTVDVGKEFAKLRKLLADDATDVKALLEFENVYEDFEQMIAKCRAGVDARQSLNENDKISVFLSVDEKFNEVSRLTRGFISRQKAIGEQTKNELIEKKKDTQIAVLIGILINVVIAVFCVRFFSKSIGRRVDSVVDNSLRFAAGKPLTPPLSGDDEIAGLDMAFRRMARTVEEARQKEQAILSNAVDIVCTINDTGRITQANPALLNALSLEEDDILSRHLLDCVTPDDRSKASEFLQLASEQRDESHRIELTLTSKDGTKRDFLWHVKYNEQDKIYYCIASDITERKALERMKQEFIAMVSHDLRSPLTAILATFDLLSGGVLGNLTDKGSNRIEMAKLSLKRLINLINDLLDLDKLESGTIEVDLKPVSADSLLVLAAESLRGMAEQNDINLETRKADILVVADEDRLMQVLTNFVSNAIKFSPPNGVVTLSCEQTNGMAEFRVNDNGRGIPPEMLGLVFERFKQVSADDHKVKKGSGLGLAISKAIVEAHGGTIGVESTVGVGSSFWFRIPNKTSV